jgi:geranylgeranyl diphosphate synthase, type II
MDFAVGDPQSQHRTPPAEPASQRAAALPVMTKVALEHALDAALAVSTVGPPRLVEAMRFSLLAPAKRVRGVLACLVARQFGQQPEAAHGIAVAIEMVHAASLILDDLPSMDDATVRRGQPACHKVYGEDTASLAAVGLMTHATLNLARDQTLAAQLRVGLIGDLASAIGADGLVGGQEQDLREGALAKTITDVETMHRRKTAVLFSLAAQAGARIAEAGDSATQHMHAFGDALGLAFQTYDDVLDANATLETAGKDVGQDANKVTAVTLLGVKRARARADAHVVRALAHLNAAGGDVTPTAQYVTSLIEQLANRAPKISGG